MIKLRVPIKGSQFIISKRLERSFKSNVNFKKRYFGEAIRAKNNWVVKQSTKKACKYNSINRITILIDRMNYQIDKIEKNT